LDSISYVGQKCPYSGENGQFGANYAPQYAPQPVMYGAFEERGYPLYLGREDYGYQVSISEGE
jgi:hypothetical protein